MRTGDLDKDTQVEDIDEMLYMKSLLPPRSTIICFFKFDYLYNNGKYGVKKSITKIQGLD